VDIFMSSVERWPRQAALQDRVRSLSYEQLAQESQRLADRLASHGVGRGDRVGVRVPSGTADVYIAVLGTLLAGATSGRATPVGAELDDCRCTTVAEAAPGPVRAKTVASIEAATTVPVPILNIRFISISFECGLLLLTLRIAERRLRGT
jgi:non-ribosomal peptide synthetase component F